MILLNTCFKIRRLEIYILKTPQNESIFINLKTKKIHFKNLWTNYMFNQISLVRIFFFNH